MLTLVFRAYTARWWVVMSIQSRGNRPKRLHRTLVHLQSSQVLVQGSRGGCSAVVQRRQQRCSLGPRGSMQVSQLVLRGYYTKDRFDVGAKCMVRDGSAVAASWQLCGKECSDSPNQLPLVKTSWWVFE